MAGAPARGGSGLAAARGAALDSGGRAREASTARRVSRRPREPPTPRASGPFDGRQHMIDTCPFVEQMTAGKKPSPAGQARPTHLEVSVSIRTILLIAGGRRPRVGAGVDRERPSSDLRLPLQRRRPLPGCERDGTAAPLEPEAVLGGAHAGDRGRPGVVLLVVTQAIVGAVHEFSTDLPRIVDKARQSELGNSPTAGATHSTRCRGTRAKSRAEWPGCRAASPTSASRPSAW